MSLNKLYQEQSDKTEKQRSILNSQVEEIDRAIKELSDNKQYLLDSFEKEQIQMLDEFNQREYNYNEEKQIELKQMISKENEIKLAQISKQSVKE